MNIEEIQDLIKFVSKSSVTQVDIERKEFRITIKKEKRAKKGRDIVTIPAQMPVNMAPAAIKHTKSKALTAKA